ncbi:MAG: efflux RND transporter periplasmic adaptor subunit [Mariprofundales bacterium]|nr:efflux RND transporter periplasmic adaptor subunit [Mariprofundales bacterium]
MGALITSCEAIIVVLLMLVSLASCSGGSSESTTGGGAIKSSSPVRTVKITTVMSSRGDVEWVERALGRVLDPDATTVAAEIPGRVTKVLVDVGDRVAKGEVLARIDASDTRDAVHGAEADLAAITARIPVQQRLVKRYRQLAGDAFVSPTILEQAEADLTALHKAAKAGQARLAQARSNLHRTRVVAPMAGRVQRRFVAAGDYIAVGKPMFQLVTDGKLLISIPIPETRIASVRAGQLVRLHLSGEQQSHDAVIGEITPMIGTGSNSVAARVHLDQPGGWRPGASVVVEIVLAIHQQAVMVPEACVVLRPAGEVVYRIDGGTHRKSAHAVNVTTGVSRGGMVEIVDGLDAGVKLAATGAGFLSDGAMVEVSR